jgi:hypothetical protein
MKQPTDVVESVWRFGEPDDLRRRLGGVDQLV